MMTASMPATRSLQEWLDELITAAPADRRMVSIRGLDAGIALRRVRCLRCSTSLNWLSAYSHLDRAEASYRNVHGAGARLHLAGDLVPVDEPVFRTSRCTRCRHEVIWASTPSGRRVSVDALPHPNGSFVLSQPMAGAGDLPLAMVLRTPADRAGAPAGSVYMAHVQTCKPPAAPVRRFR